MATHFNVNHDTGPPVSNHWDVVTDTNSTLSVTASAGLNSTAFGLEYTFTIGVDNASQVKKFFSAPGSNEFNFRFRFDPNSISVPGGGTNTILDIYLWEGAPDNKQYMWIKISHSGGGYVYQAYVEMDNDGSPRLVIGTTVLSDVEHCFEMTSVRETADGNNDGITKFIVDGVEVYSVANEQNFNGFATLDELRVDSSSLTSVVDGDLYVDELLMDTNSSVQLCPSLGGFHFHGVANIDADGSNLLLPVRGQSDFGAMLQLATDLSSNPTQIASKSAGAEDEDTNKYYTAHTVTHPNDTNVIWFLAKNSIQISRDAGISFVDVTANLSATVEVSAIVIGPGLGQLLVYDTDAGNFYETLDYGATWTSIASSAPDFPQCIARAGIDPNTILLAIWDDADAGDLIFLSPNRGLNVEDVTPLALITSDDDRMTWTIVG